MVVINVIVLVVIGGYFINGYSWLFHCKPLVVILLLAIDGYFINGYCWLLYVILQLLVIIVLYIIVGYFML
jgi:hypothetical protein